MKSIFVLSVLSREMRSAIAARFLLMGVVPSQAKLATQLLGTIPDVIVVEMSRLLPLDAPYLETFFATLQHIRVMAPASHLVLWSDAASPEFACRCLSLGVRGVISKTASQGAHLRCLAAVAAGNLWMEQPLTSLIGSPCIDSTEAPIVTETGDRQFNAAYCAMSGGVYWACPVPLARKMAATARMRSASAGVLAAAASLSRFPAIMPSWAASLRPEGDASALTIAAFKDAIRGGRGRCSGSTDRDRRGPPRN